LPVTATDEMQGYYSPGKPGKVREVQSGHGKVREKSGNHNQFLQAREGKQIE